MLWWMYKVAWVIMTKNFQVFISKWERSGHGNMTSDCMVQSMCALMDPYGCVGDFSGSLLEFSCGNPSVEC